MQALHTEGMKCYFSKAFTASLLTRLMVASALLNGPCSLSQTGVYKVWHAKDTITLITVDRAGDFYVVDKSGLISKVDKDGELIAEYSAAPTLTSFDPTNAIRLLVWYKSDKTYGWLSPNLESGGVTTLDPSWAIEPALLCPSGDYAFWIYDAADHAMKRILLNESVLQTEFALQHAINKPKISFIKEYLNFVFAIDEIEGLFIFNNRGKLLKHLPEPKATVHFLGEELYYLHQGRVFFFNLYTAEKRSMPIPNTAKALLLTDERMVLQSNSSQLLFYQWQP
jgi:hypothetical protein